MSPARKRCNITAYILAAWSTVCFIVFMVMAAGLIEGDEVTEAIVGVVFLLGAGLPAVVGAGMSMTALRPGGPNGFGVWLGLGWNSLVLAGMLVMVVIGVFFG